MARPPKLRDPETFLIGFAFGAWIALSVVIAVFAEEVAAWMGWQ